MEKWEDKKNFNFSHFCLVGVEKRRDGKASLYKFTHTPLLKNDGQLIQKKKKKSPNLLKNKNHVLKKKNHV